ncbi:MAG: 30S ribosome-binding factor RbfA [Gemmatimonadetes bacterium]|nr:30S ribosome-binding factor RbfA [Gemmatimonadota bacterium]MYB98065.1 30S ribosome-binding factor RbfA [Gemmatimonadota bacterium]MYI47089.1 30S ribosome-binding factor RbfA [Gemmatimonadota bacterium]
MSSRRRVRLGEQLRRELSVKIQYLVRDPEVGPLSVTGVDVSADLWFARVYVEPQGSADEQDRTMAALGRAAPFLRSVLGRELHIRRMPELRFERDTSIEAGQRIESILREVLPARDAEEGPGEEGPGRTTDPVRPPGTGDP